MINQLHLTPYIKFAEKRPGVPQGYYVKFKMLFDEYEHSLADVDPYTFLHVLKDTVQPWQISNKPLGYYLWNCSCGIPDCANLMGSHIISCNDDVITFAIPDPISYHNYREWLSHHKKKVVRLSRQQIKDELMILASNIDQIMEETNGIVLSFDCGVQTYDPDEVIRDYAAAIRIELAEIDEKEQKISAVS